MRLLLAAVLLYVAVSLFMGLDLPGLQYDEAIYEHGAVALITGDRAIDFAREDRSWITVGERPIPLMVIAYAGAAKFYLLAIPYAIFGTAPAVGRVVSMLLGAFGIFGIGRAVQLRAGDLAGAAVAFILAIHPQYVGWTIYDNAGTALWMANCGFIALALSRFANQASRASAFLLGFSIGFALWGRANFVWIVGGLFVAALPFLRRRFLAQILAGSIVGGAPLILFELITGFATLRIGGNVKPTDVIAARFYNALSSLGYDAERAFMWGGTGAPQWQLYAIGVTVAIAMILPWLVSSGDSAVRVGRFAAVAGLVAYALPFTMRVTVHAHHFAALLPLPAIAVAMAGVWLARKGRLARLVVIVVSAAYLTFAFAWNRAAHNGLAATRGVGMWSHAISDVAHALLKQNDDRPVQILDWGLGNGLYVLTRARVPFWEIFWRADEHFESPGDPWMSVVQRGGRFLMNSPNNTHFARPALGFQRALEQSGAKYSVKTFYQASGAEYARLYDVEPAP